MQFRKLQCSGFPMRRWITSAPTNPFLISQCTTAVLVPPNLAVQNTPPQTNLTPANKAEFGVWMESGCRQVLEGQRRSMSSENHHYLHLLGTFWFCLVSFSTSVFALFYLHFRTLRSFLIIWPWDQPWLWKRQEWSISQTLLANDKNKQWYVESTLWKEGVGRTLWWLAACKTVSCFLTIKMTLWP